MAGRKVEDWQGSCLRAWRLHFIVCMLVVFAGIAVNGGDSKLIPSRLVQEGCSKTLVNVLAATEEEDSSTVCCATDSYSLLCLKSYPPLYKRLTRLPDALIIPLFPIILRGLVLVWQTLASRRTCESWTTYLKRFIFYLVLLSLRGYALFVGFNWIEEQIVGAPPEECWFSEYVRRGRFCHGAEFDYSDHTVLYLSQILSIPLTEVAYSWLNPIAPGSTISTIVTGGLLYLYFVALYGEFQTASYYHTPSEILVGFAISLIIQAPLAYVQCSPAWSRMRTNLFGISSSVDRKD